VQYILSSFGLIPATTCGNITMMKTLWEARKKIIGLGAIVLLVLLMMNLNSRLNEYFHLSSERDKLGTEVSFMRATKVALDTAAAYATSDKAVEDWARDEARMARPGDKVIVPLTPANQTLEPVIEVTPTPTSVENWQFWWALFFE
jgi:cell division protein FtsB